MSDIATPDSVPNSVSGAAAHSQRGASAEAQAARPPSEPPVDASGFWWRVAGIAWIGAVLAYVWGRYALPFEPTQAWEAARERIAPADWMLIVAAILAPLLLLAALASMLRRSRQLSAESRSMAEAARRMTEEARAAPRGEAWRGAALVGEVEGASPAHIRREVERATHAIGALHQQMRSIEDALASQSAALDDAAERAEARAKTITESLRLEREALQSLVTSIEADGGRAMNLVALRPDDMEKTQRTLAALKSQSDAIERTVEAAGLRLNAIAADIQQALRKAGPSDAGTLAEGARASVREAAHDAIGAIGETEAATRARLFEGEGGKAVAAALADDEAAELRRRNLADLRRQMDRLRNGDEDAAQDAAFAGPAFAKGLDPRLAGAAGAVAAGAAGAAAAAKRAGGGVVDGAKEAVQGVAAKAGVVAESLAAKAESAVTATGAAAARLGGAQPEPNFAPAFTGLERPPEGAGQPPIMAWDVEPPLGDFDVDLVETEPLDRDAAALAARAQETVQTAAAVKSDVKTEVKSGLEAAAAAFEAKAPPAARSSSPLFDAPAFAAPKFEAPAETKTPEAAPLQTASAPPPAVQTPAQPAAPVESAPLFGDPTPPRVVSFDPSRLAPLADLNIPSPHLSGEDKARPSQIPSQIQGQTQSRTPATATPGSWAAPQTPAAQPPAAEAQSPLRPAGSDLGGGPASEPAARGWLGASAPGGGAPGGLDSFGERREVEAASAAAPPPRPSIVWRQPETPMFGSRATPRPKPLDWSKVALGLNFPVSEEDAEAEEALYEVSIDHQIGALIQASEDMLAVLVDLRLYMEDHTPRIAPPEGWRDWLDGRVSHGGQPVVEIGPEEALSRVRDLIDRDPAVERLAVSFAGRFEDLIRRALDEAPDPQIVTRLVDSRTGRAYAMVACAGGRVE